MAKYELLFVKDLSFVIVIFGCSIPTTHEIYRQNGNTMKNILVSNLLIKLFNYDICSGIKDYNSNETTQHIVPCKTDPNALLQNRTAASNLNTLLYIRSTKCEFLCLSNICKERSTIKSVKKSQAKIDAPAKAKAPLSKTHPKRILLSLQEERKKTKKLENVIARMQKEISSKSITINSGIADDVEEVINKNLNASPFRKLFCKQQKSSQNKGSGVRYHPMVIRFCLSIASKSASAYNELPSSNVLTLPRLQEWNPSNYWIQYGSN